MNTTNHPLMVGIDAAIEGTAEDMNLFKQWKSIFTNTAYVYQTICILAVVAVFGFVMLKSKNETVFKFRHAAFLLMFGQIFSALYYYTIDSAALGSFGFNFNAQFQQAMTFIAVMHFTQSIRWTEAHGDKWWKHAHGFTAATLANATLWTFVMTYAKFESDSVFENVWMANFSSWFVLSIWLSVQLFTSTMGARTYTGLPNIFTKVNSVAYLSFATGFYILHSYLMYNTEEYMTNGNWSTYYMWCWMFMIGQMTTLCIIPTVCCFLVALNPPATAEKRLLNETHEQTDGLMA